MYFSALKIFHTQFIVDALYALLITPLSNALSANMFIFVPKRFVLFCFVFVFP